jgi:hypothetical protein
VLRDCALRVTAGRGIVARSSSTVVVVPDSSATELLAKLLVAVAEHERSSAGSSSRQLIRDVAALFALGEAELPPFALVADEGDGVALLLHGDMDARISQLDGATEEISGRQSMTWVDRVVSAPFAEIVVGAPAAEAPTVPFDLRDGLVPGDGVTLRVRASEAAADSSEVPLDAAAVPVAPIPPPEPALPDVPAPSAESDRAELVAEDTVVLVQGVTCARGHFNRPDVSYCSVCGTSMVHQTLQPVQGPRPPLGILVLGDGTVIGLDRDVVIGREPHAHADVAAGRARAVVVEDPDLTVSREHAEVRLDGWDVKVMDCGSANGTEIIPPNAQDAIVLEAGQAIKVVPGSKIVLGRYTVSFNSSLH